MTDDPPGAGFIPALASLCSARWEESVRFRLRLGIRSTLRHRHPRRCSLPLLAQLENL